MHPLLTFRRTSSTDQPEDATTPLSLHRRLLSQQRQSLLTSEGGWLHSAGPGGRRLPLSIEFRDLGLRLRSCGKVWCSAACTQVARSVCCGAPHAVLSCTMSSHELRYALAV